MNSVLLSTACPTSLASDQTKGGGRPGVQGTPRFGAREQKIRSDEDTALIQIESKRSCSWPLRNPACCSSSVSSPFSYLAHTLRATILSEFIALVVLALPFAGPSELRLAPVIRSLVTSAIGSTFSPHHNHNV